MVFSRWLGSVVVFSAFVVVCQGQSITVVGAMKNTMWNGQLSGLLSLDSLSGKSDLYGVGPLEFLRGEILLLAGKPYASTVLSANRMTVQESPSSKAPFFVYASVNGWRELSGIPPLVTPRQVEVFLDSLAFNQKVPFVFRIISKVNRADIHVMNVPEGKAVKSPNDAHESQVNYQVKGKEVEIIGFFSRSHQTVFTHHDTYLHMHLITADRTLMGHVDDFRLIPSSVKLFVSFP